MRKILKYFIIFLIFFVIAQNHISIEIYASQEISSNSGVLNDEEALVPSLQILFMLTLITLAPFLLLMMTSFTRVLISMYFLRSALGTQQMPPNQVLIGLSLFVTFFIMGPIFTEINTTAIQPYVAGEIGQEEVIHLAMEPMREFMFLQVENKDMSLFIELSGEEYASHEEIPNSVLLPAFMLGELTKGFKIGFLIYIPFLVIDMVVASVLMAMGMMMLPPAMISLPFKLLLFVMVDGWSLILEGVILTFRK